MTEHNNTRLRLDVRFRELTVLRTETVTPHMRRIVLGGEQRPPIDIDIGVGLRPAIAGQGPDQHELLFLEDLDLEAGQKLRAMALDTPAQALGALLDAARDGVRLDRFERLPGRDFRTSKHRNQ